MINKQENRDSGYVHIISLFRQQIPDIQSLRSRTKKDLDAQTK